jgi:hypothetical protein
VSSALGLMAVPPGKQMGVAVGPNSNQTPPPPPSPYSGSDFLFFSTRIPKN